MTLTRFLMVSLISTTTLQLACKQTKADTQPAMAEIKSKEYHFKTIKYPDSVNAHFTLRNIGKNDLLVKAVETSCGCTVASITKDSIPAKDSAIVAVTFKPDSNQVGYIRKSVVLKLNTEDIFHVVYISGNVD
ncbi:DUF1573 domain-containing protein [Pedobacter faecalis]|uniref:DUF1573 domain-containing protein n=1 Tax=Pedobacter faecalis TaxID=3041495 RepID=UPI00254CAC37|nr:DUF1573 domain-containing protein [Pedobacter sp. ELA7]